MSRDGFQYSDGDAAESAIIALLRSTSRRGADVPIDVECGASDWPSRYHLGRARANLLRHLDFSGLAVLELGAGMGGVSRWIGEQAARLLAVEGSARRAEALALRLEGLNQASVEVATIATLPPRGPFDVVCLVGVLEYAALYPIDDGDPWQATLNAALAQLSPDGVLLLAIENALGAKYLAGCGEDHLGTLFDGLLGYPVAPGPRTFSRRELAARLARAGLGHQLWSFPFPDYKLPLAVLDARFVEAWPEAAADIACAQPWEDYAQARAELLPDYLLCRELARAGLLADFANSFLVLASRRPDSTVLARLRRRSLDGGEAAWLYGDRRRVAVDTVFVDGPRGWIVRKHPRQPHPPGNRMQWQGQTEVPMRAGLPLRQRLLRRAWFGDGLGLVEDFEAILRWTLEHFGRGDDQLHGTAIDAVFPNLLEAKRWPELRAIDQEWRWHDTLPASWLIARNLLMLNRDWNALSERLGISSLAALYAELCTRLGLEARLEHDLALEAGMQAEVMQVDEDQARAALEALFAKRLPRAELRPRDPAFLRRGAEAILAHRGIWNIYGDPR